MSWKRNGDNPFNTPGLGAAGMSMGPPNGAYYDDPYASDPTRHGVPPANFGYGNDRYPPPMQQPPQAAVPPIQQKQYQSPLDAEVDMVLNEIKNELISLDSLGGYETFRNTRRVMNSEITKLENNVDPEWIELDVDKEIKLVKKVLIPQYRYPRFNFVGKLLGPKAQTLQNLAKKFKCHVYVLGKGSTRDRTKEQELLQSGDPQYAHYSGPLHVKIETSATPEVAYERVAGVLSVLKKLLEPVRDTFIEGITPVAENSSDDKSESGKNESANTTSQNTSNEQSAPPQSQSFQQQHVQQTPRQPPQQSSNRGGSGGNRGGRPGKPGGGMNRRAGGSGGNGPMRGGSRGGGGGGRGGPPPGRGGGPPRGGPGFGRGGGGRGGGGPPRRFQPY